MSWEEILAELSFLFLAPMKRAAKNLGWSECDVSVFLLWVWVEISSTLVGEGISILLVLWAKQVN